MKATLEFDLSEEGDREEYRLATRASDLSIAVDDFLKMLRSSYKYNQSIHEDLDKLDQTIQEIVSRAMSNLLIQCLNERDIHEL